MSSKIPLRDECERVSPYWTIPTVYLLCLALKISRVEMHTVYMFSTIFMYLNKPVDI